MSRIGKAPINISSATQVCFADGLIKVKGLKGELEKRVPAVIGLEIKGQEIKLLPKDDAHQTKMLWGTWRSLIAGMVQGVEKGFVKVLEIEGVGYKAELKGNKLVLSLGFSHTIEVEAPAGIDFKVEKNIITITGFDKQLVGQIAAKIRAYKKPEPYKGKGIRYQGEIVRRKQGKKAAGAEGK